MEFAVDSISALNWLTLATMDIRIAIVACHGIGGAGIGVRITGLSFTLR